MPSITRSRNWRRSKPARCTLHDRARAWAAPRLPEWPRRSGTAGTRSETPDCPERQNRAGYDRIIILTSGNPITLPAQPEGQSPPCSYLLKESARSSLRHVTHRTPERAMSLTLRGEAFEIGMVSLAKKLGKGESSQNVKPFIETLRVTNPVRQSRASSRKRVLRGDGRPSLRSVDSEIKRCVIEPRNYLVVSPRLGHSRGPSQALATPGPTGVPGHTGVGGTWRMITRVSRELGRPCRLHRDCRPETRLTNSRLIHGPRPEPWGRTRDETMVSPSEGNEVRRNGRQGVAVPHSSVEAGERPSRTPWSEGGAALWTGSWNHAEDIVPHQRVTAKPPSRVRDSDSTT